MDAKYFQWSRFKSRISPVCVGVEELAKSVLVDMGSAPKGVRTHRVAVLFAGRVSILMKYWRKYPIFAYLLKLSRPVGVWEGGECARHGAKKGPPPPPHMTGGHSNIHQEEVEFVRGVRPLVCSTSQQNHFIFDERSSESESSRPLVLCGPLSNSTPRSSG